MPENNIGQPEAPKPIILPLLEQAYLGAERLVAAVGDFVDTRTAGTIFGDLGLMLNPYANPSADSEKKTISATDAALPTIDIGGAESAAGAKNNKAQTESSTVETKSATSLPSLDVGNEKAEGQPGKTALDTAETGGKSASSATKLPLNEAAILETYRQAIINPEPALIELVTPEVRGVSLSELSAATRANSVPGLRKMTRAVEEAKRLGSPEERLKTQIEMHEVHRVKSVHTSGWAEGFGTGVVVAIPLTWAAHSYFNSKEQNAIKSSRTLDRTKWGGTD